MRSYLTLILIITAYAGCPAPRTTSPQPANPPAGVSMNGATSPSGEAHPGTLLTEDKVDGRTWTDRAEDVPQTLAWVDIDGTWVAVVRIEVTGLPGYRRFTKYDADKKMLESTVEPPPPPQPEDPIVPVPTPSE